MVSSMQEAVQAAIKSKTQKPRLKNLPGELAWIPKSQLNVDHAYQRSIIKERVNALADNWSWVACGALIVALRPDGEWMVVEGQHRKMAADKIDTIDKLPCIVFELDDITTEAQGFLDANTNRRALTMVERFKALELTDNAEAKIVRELAIQANREIRGGTSPTTLTCISTLLKLVKENETTVRRIWPIIVDLCRDHVLSQDIVAGMYYIENKLDRKDTLSSSRWRRRIHSVGYAAIHQAMQNASALRGGRTPSALAEGIVVAINRGLQYKLEYKQ